MDKINMQEKFSRISEYWSPKIIGEINDSCVKIAKLKGEFLWHSHAAEDEMFYVFKGALTIRLRDGDIHLGAGECFIIPKGVEHMPVADEEVQVMMIEPKHTLNTGNVINERTVTDPERI
ncbi:MAG TPA: cupin domain-containing protein [Candidatus Limiplasma sp.]|nr:cupin domain-containing protein [Candidatus Limiplasma sp.]